MRPFNARPEIDSRTIKLIVGLIALGLAPLTSALSPSVIDSISASYYEGGWAQSIFIGFLFAIAAFLLAYNGCSWIEMALSKLAAIAALGVALFPCVCGTHSPPIPWAHGVASALMFGILAGFCLIFYRRALDKPYPQARHRARVYAVCGLAIVLAIGVIALDWLLDGALARTIPRLVFQGEATALAAFGISWLTASHILPWINHADERFAPWREHNPEPSHGQRT